jgi:Icc-related predicted phosphoesterase
MKGRIILRDRRFLFVGQDGEHRVLPYQLVERIATAPHCGDSLRLAAFSDFRVQNLNSLIRFFKSQDQPDLILYAGDDIRRFHEGGTNFFERLADISRYGLCAIAGNDDRPEVRDLITGRNVYSVHCCPLVFESFAIIGVEGAPMFPIEDGFDRSYNKGHLLYPERILRGHMRTWEKPAIDRKHLIVLSHTPPFGILDFARRFGQRHIGSRPLREFLESSPKALLCVSGHVHSQGARSEKFGNALVVNAASHDGPGDPGRVAMIDITKGVVSTLSWHEID